jgi:hypothetical protein
MDDYGIWFECAAHGCLTEYYLKGGVADTQQKLKWCEDVASILHFIHKKKTFDKLILIAKIF